MYQLIIHHDTGVKKEGLKLVKDSNLPGHVYLELKENDDSTVYGIDYYAIDKQIKHENNNE